MSAILNSLNAHNFLIFQPILMTLVSEFMVYRALSDKLYLLIGLLSSLILIKLVKTPLVTHWGGQQGGVMSQIMYTEDINTG